ncbi:hypothetical protein SAMN02744133_108193 [Thalassospira xiamenensis M-5 = DSM 17429]|uniref:Uncharacterized protein n=1 Tax=Thalassospira xiamenensis M-5 = DSM 17429 TaxID=1123366 RepID=A0AB72UK39_9PROT|nr:hypothetical protein TH3_21948 [Thalassospira xiamenensis M-5 = DSM 17429]SIT22371.1 hypothetical protein SAMN02744133_108193 [Thalassospira xiamenensis M-5 = DSM 17429]
MSGHWKNRSLKIIKSDDEVFYWERPIIIDQHPINQHGRMICQVSRAGQADNFTAKDTLNRFGHNDASAIERTTFDRLKQISIELIMHAPDTIGPFISTTKAYQGRKFGSLIHCGRLIWSGSRCRRQ